MYSPDQQDLEYTKGILLGKTKSALDE